MEDIELKYLPESESDNDKQEFIVNIELNCFLCLQNYNYNVHQSNNDNCIPSDKNEGKLTLLRVCRYLKLDCSNILSQSPNPLLLLTGNISSPLVNICPKCTPIFETLSNLLEQLEILQMKVNFALGQFTKIMKDAEDHKNIYQNFRAELIKKCDKRLNSILPKVVIESIQCKQNPVRTKSPVKLSKPSHQPATPVEASQADNKLLLAFLPKPKKSNTLQCKDCHTFFTHKRNLQTHRRNMHGEKIDYYCLRCHAKFGKRPEFLKHRNFTCPRLPDGISNSNPPPGYRACRICRPSKFIYANNWQRHNIRFHIETYFKPTQVPGLIPESFKNYCEYVFRIQQKSAKIIQNPDNTVTRKCHYCTATFMDQTGLRAHLVKAHKTVIRNLVIAAQKKITLEQIEKSANRPINSQSQHQSKPVMTQLDNDDDRMKLYTCTLCQPNRKINLLSKSRHDAHLHPDIIFSAVRHESVTEQDFKKYCDYLFKTEIQSFRRVANGNANPRIECGHCRRICCDRSSTRNHLSVSHQDILSEKLANLQKTVGLAEIVEKKKVVRSSVKIAKGNPKYEQMGRKCRHCRRMFSTEANLRRHLNNVHQIKVKQVGSKPSANLAGYQNEMVERMEIVQDEFEQSAVFVTKMDVSSYPQHVVNYVEMEVNGNQEVDEYFAENDEEAFDMDIVPDKDPLEM